MEMNNVSSSLFFAVAKSRAPLYVGIGLLIFGLMMISIGIKMRRDLDKRSKNKD